MTKDDAANILEKYKPLIPNEKFSKAKDMAVYYLRQESMVSLEVFNQVAWERDIAIKQLNDLGYEFGEK